MNQYHCASVDVFPEHDTVAIKAVYPKRFSSQANSVPSETVISRINIQILELPASSPTWIWGHGEIAEV